MSAAPEPAPWHLRIFRNTLVNGASMALGVVVAFVLTPFLIRYLGASGFGLWSLIGAFSVSAGYLSLADLGIQQTTVKLVAEREAREEWQEVGDILKASLWLFLLIGLALGAGMGLFTVALLNHVFEIPAQLDHDVRLAFLLFSISIPIELCTLPFAAVLEGRQRYGLLRATELVRTSVWIAAVLIVLPRGGGLVTLSAANLGASVLGIAVTVFAARRMLPAGTVRRGRSSRATLRRLFSFSINMFLAQVTGVLYRQMDRIIIIVALTSVLLAQYEIASKLQLLAALSLTFTVSAVFPAASSLSATDEGRGRLKTMFLEGTKYSCGIAIPVTIALMIWADDLVLTWVGPEFAPSIGYAQWFLAWVIPTAATALGHTMIVGIGYVREAMYLGLASAVINLALSIALVRPYGVMGVIIGTLVGYCLVWYPYMRLFLRKLDVTWSEFGRRTAAPIVVVCVPWAAIVLVVHLEVHANTLVGAFSAAAASIVSGWLAIFFFGLRPDERRELLASARALGG